VSFIRIAVTWLRPRSINALKSLHKTPCSGPRAGPAIGPAHFEVGDEVRAQFLADDARAAAGFTANTKGRWQCDLTLLAKQRLARIGVTRISAVERCTYADAANCYSYRRDGQTGRMAALIWRRGGGP